MNSPTPWPTIVGEPAVVTLGTPPFGPPSTTIGMTSRPATANHPVSSPSGGDLTVAVFSGVVVAAAVTAVVNTALARRNSRIEERARVRATLAEAYQAYADYKEFPYAIRRRGTDQQEEERIRLSEEIRKVQSRISYYQAWTQAESPETGAAYNELITTARTIAGAAMRKAWEAPGLENDAGMNIGPDRVNLTSLKPAEDMFIAATKKYVAAVTAPWWKRTINWGRTRRQSRTAP